MHSVQNVSYSLKSSSLSLDCSPNSNILDSISCQAHSRSNGGLDRAQYPPQTPLRLLFENITMQDRVLVFCSSYRLRLVRNSALLGLLKALDTCSSLPHPVQDMGFPVRRSMRFFLENDFLSGATNRLFSTCELNPSAFCIVRTCESLRCSSYFSIAFEILPQSISDVMSVL